MNAWAEWPMGSDPPGPQLQEAAKELLAFAGEARLLFLRAPMGAGKTTLIAEIAKALGINEPVSSPTFALMQEYRSPHGNTLLHFDFYRIETPGELHELGIYEQLNRTDALLAIEWPDIAFPSLPPGGIEVQIAINHSNGTRTLRARHT